LKRDIIIEMYNGSFDDLTNVDCRAYTDIELCHNFDLQQFSIYGEKIQETF